MKSSAASAPSHLRPLRTLLLFAASSENSTLSYQRGWPRAFCEHPAFRCEAVNVLERRGFRRLELTPFIAPRRYDAVVLLHSTFSNGPAIPPGAFRAIARLQVPKAVFLGNEYKLMPEKIRFVEELGATLLVSQLSSPEALDLYRARLDCRVVTIPNTGVDLAALPAAPAAAERPIDLGYRAFDAPVYLGHRERREIAERASAEAARRALQTDISLDPAARLVERDWLAFLGRCRGQLGTEAGGDYFELDDATRAKVNTLLAEHPETPFEEIHDRFFAPYENAVSGRALSGRIVEASAMRSVQLLLRGDYGGLFRAGEHYIPISHDFSNLDEAFDTFADPAVCGRIVDAAYELVATELTYRRLIDRFRQELEAALQ